MCALVFCDLIVCCWCAKANDIVRQGHGSSGVARRVHRVPPAGRGGEQLRALEPRYCQLREHYEFLFLLSTEIRRQKKNIRSATVYNCTT